MVKVKISDELMKEIEKKLEEIKQENAMLLKRIMGERRTIIEEKPKEEKPKTETVKVSISDFFEHLKKCPHCKAEARKILEEEKPKEENPKTEEKKEEKPKTEEKKEEHVIETKAKKFY
jgi:uncharacterized protein with PIN domain